MPETTLPALTPEDMQMLWTDGKTYPFVESDDCLIMGFGHPDPAEFAVLVSDYDRAAGQGEGAITASGDVSQLWAVRLAPPSADSDTDTSGWWLKMDGVTPTTPGAFPISVVQR